METKIVKGKVAQPKAGEELVVIAPEEVQDHLEWGKALCQKNRYEEALAEFEAVLRTAPGSIETRIWIRKTKEALAQPKVVVATEEAEATEAAKPHECIWMKLGMVTHRICTKNHDCLHCEFDQTMQEKMAKEDAEEMEAIIERFKDLPGSQRICRYARHGNISFRLCTRLFQCNSCQFGQNMDDAIQRKLAKLAVRRETLRQRETKE